MRFFNTSGPVVPADHYCIPPLSRVDLADVPQLVRNKRCFVLHPLRQTGKTSVLLALRGLLNGGETYFDQLADKLQEDRVRRVVEPLLNGGDERGFTARYIEYVRDFGLVAQHPPLRIANPICAEVVPRELTWAAQEGRVEDTAWYVNDGGGLNLGKLLTAFQAFFREHSEHWVERFHYRETGPQLLLQAFLQRIVNGGGRIEREYGRGRTDLLILWSQDDRTRRFVVECKVLHKGLERTIEEGLRQTAGYMDRCAAESGHPVIFDRDEGRSWEEKVFCRKESAGGVEVVAWGM